MSTEPGRGGGAVVPLAQRSRRGPAWPVVPAAVLAAIIVAAGYENGAAGLTARTVLAVGLWVGLVLAVGIGLVSHSPPRAAVLALAFLAGLACWTLASAFWAPSAERAFDEFNRVALYVAVFAAAALLARGRDLRWWVAGLHWAVSAIVAVALVSRFVPGSFSSRDLGAFLPNAATRLSFPLGYWNALAVLAAFAVPLATALALTAGSRTARAAANAVVPAAAAVVVLASSRGGALAALVGGVVVVAASARRLDAIRVVAVAMLGAAAAVLALRANAAIVDGPLGTAHAAHAGHVAGILVAVVVVATGLLTAASERLGVERRRVSPRALRIALVVLAALCVLGVVAAHPVRRFDEFRQPPSTSTAPNFTSAHLTSGSGSGRWQFWTAAVDEWRSAPLVGRGAGSYQSWWAQHASFTYFLRNAHSLYLETLGELGVVGLVLLGGFLVAGFAGAVRSLRGATRADRELLAALTAVAAAFFTSAAIDWTWQLTVVAVVGVAALGVAAGAQVGESAALRVQPGVVAAALVVAWAVLVAQAIPWLVSNRIDASRAAVERRDLGAAASAAHDAKTVAPWAATPYVQLALVAEARRDYPSARHWIAAATSRASSDWAVWYVASRIEREAGDPQAAKDAYDRSKALNPRSPVFAGGR